MPHRRTTALERFHRSVAKTTDSETCWLWTASLSHGYGQLSVGHHSDGDFRMMRAHRFALEHALGRPLGVGMHALHTCDNPACVRYDEPGTYEINGVSRLRFGHLWEGTIQDNAADRTAKGHDTFGERNGSFLHPERVACGSAKPNAILTEDRVREIRAVAAAGDDYIAFANKYGITSRKYVYRIVRRECWKHVA